VSERERQKRERKDKKRSPAIIVEREGGVVQGRSFPGCLEAYLALTLVGGMEGGGRNQIEGGLVQKRKGRRMGTGITFANIGLTC